MASLPEGIVVDVIDSNHVKIYENGRHIGDVDREPVGPDDPSDPDRLVWRIVPVSHIYHAYTDGLPYASSRSKAIRRLALGDLQIGGTGIH